MALIDSVIHWVIKKRIHQIGLFKKYPHDVQGELFKKLIYTARDTLTDRAPLSVNVFPQPLILHANGFSPVCTRMCV